MLNKILNMIILLTCLFFAGATVYRYIDVHNDPVRYMADSAPWYTALIPILFICLTVIAACLIIKTVIKKRNDR